MTVFLELYPANIFKITATAVLAILLFVFLRGYEIKDRSSRLDMVISIIAIIIGLWKFDDYMDLADDILAFSAVYCGIVLLLALRWRINHRDATV